MSASGGTDIGASASCCHRAGAGGGVGSVGSVTIPERTISSAGRASRPTSIACSSAGSRTNFWARCIRALDEDGLPRWRGVRALDYRTSKRYQDAAARIAVSSSPW